MSNAADLLFSRPPVSGAPHLVFGDDGGAPAIAHVTLHASGQLSGLRGHVTLRAATVLHTGARLSGLRGSIRATYDINVERPTVSQQCAHWQNAAPVSSGARASWQQSGQTSVSTASRWQDAAALHQSARAGWQSALALRQQLRAHEQAAQQVSVQTASGWQSALALHIAAGGRFQESIGLPAAPMRAHWQESIRDRAAVLRARWQDAAPRSARTAQRNTAARQLDRALRQHWQEAWTPRPGRSSILPPLPPAPEPCYLPSAHLLFSQPWTASANLLFVCERHGPGPNPEPGATVVVPIQRTYIVINSISLRRVDTGVELHAHGFNMTLDYQSWTWTWSAALHHDAEGHLGRDSNGDFAELEAVVNGIHFRLRLERTVCDRRFNPTRWAVSGRGKASVLSGPVMSFGNTVDRTAQQLMADALTVNGASLGWAVGWGLTDWLVPAGAWSLRGSYIDAVNDIAAAGGGYVQPHPTDATLRILPRYPVAPWNWGSVAPDFEIPDVAEVEGTEYIDKPGYNKVFVGGVGAGVFGPFKRAGTAGDILAPQVTHALITHADAHRQRGLAELSDTGRQEHITLKMQVLEETGIIMPGQFVRYAGEKTVVGIVRSTSIDWSRPVLRQTIGIETHA